MSNKPLTRIDVRATARSVEGELTGVKIGTVSGNVSVQYTRPSTPPEPPDPEVIRAYLQIARKRHAAPEGSDPREVELWKADFYAHPPDTGERAELYGLVQSVFSRQRARGGFQRLVLLADAGLGKTPALNALCRIRAEESSRLEIAPCLFDGGGDQNGRGSDKDCVIPLFIELAHLVPQQPLITLICDHFNAVIRKDGGTDKITTDQAQGMIEHYPFLFLFDDLGALISSENAGGFQMLGHFMEVYGDVHQFVVSSQTSRYRQQLGSVDTLYLDRLSEDQLRAILGDADYEQLTPLTRNYLRNRNLLSRFISLGRSDEAIKTAGHLVRISAQSQLEESRKKIEAEDFDIKFIRGLLENLALQMRREHNQVYDERQLAQFIVAYLDSWQEPRRWSEVVQLLEDAGFLSYNDDRRYWAFRDNSVQAYFAASAVTYDPGQLELILREASDYWWRDFFELLVGISAKPVDLLVKLIDQDALAAANCIRFAEPGVVNAIEDTLIDALNERLKIEDSARRKYIIERIGESNHERAAELLLQTIHRDWSSMVFVAAVRSLLALQKRNPGKVSIEKAEQKVLHSLFRTEGSITEVFKHFPKDQQPGDVQALLEILCGRAHPPRIRGMAAIGLGLGRSEQGFQALCAALENDRTDDFVAWCAVEVLAQVRHPAVDDYAIQLYKSKTKKGKHFLHRRARSVYLLGWAGKGSDELLREALADPSQFVRGYAVEAMARRDLLGARQLIEAMLPKEQELFVEQKIVEALGNIGTLESIAVLEQHLNSLKSHARCRVRWAIAEIKERNALA